MIHGMMTLAAALTALAAALTATVECDSESADETAKTVAAPTDQPAEPLSDVDRILKLAEKAGEATKRFQADFDYHLNESLIDENEWRMGRMSYRSPSELKVAFADGQKESYVFLGRRYIENRPAQKQRYVHILRKDTQPKITILDVEQLPFPQPFGGKRKTLTENYEITYKGRQALGPWRRPGAKVDQTKAPEGEFEHLTLMPKPNSAAAKEYVRVAFWIDGKTGLLRQVRTVDKSERILTVRFRDIKVNDAAKDVTDEAFKPDTLPKDWQETVNDHTADAPPAP